MPRIIKEEPNPPIIDNTTTTGESEEKEVRNTSDDATIDDEFTTRTTTEEEEDEKSNNYYDNIDNKILQTEYEVTIVFKNCEGDEIRPPTTTTKDLTPFTVDELAQVIPILAKLLDEDTVVYVIGMLLEDPYENDTRETVCEILMEALSSHYDCDGFDRAALCDGPFMLIDPDQQQEQQ